MASVIEEIESPTKTLTGEELLKLLSTPEGQQLLASANRLQNKANEPAVKPHTEEQIKKFFKMAERDDVYYLRIDPVTKKPLEEAKEFCWKIVSAFPILLGSTEVSESEMPSLCRVAFSIQKCYRNKFDRKPKDPKSDPGIKSFGENESIEIRAHWAHHNRQGELKVPGERQLDASDFMAQFQREESE